MVEASQALQGPALLDALRRGGYVLYLRHATVQSPHPVCADGPGLDASGLLQAQNAGAAIRTLGWPIDVVWTSRTCRTEQTARALGLGPVQITDDLNPGGLPEGSNHEQVRLARLGATPTPGKNTVLVSHFHGSSTVQRRLQLEMGEFIVFQPRGDVAPVAVARIRPAEWSGLLALPR